MTKSVLKRKLTKAITESNDEWMLNNVYQFMRKMMLSEEYEISDEDKVELDERLARDKAGLERSYSWEEVKKLVRKRKKI
ncbi:MAG: hypothetical protein HY064_07145 [Bacteroidetes bacterium]|nr:hypothetical protein [Bacteroidota bacterium]